MVRRGVVVARPEVRAIWCPTRPLGTPRRPGSRIEKIQRAAAGNPSTSEGDVLTVDFNLAGQQFIGLNGGPDFRFTEAISFSIDCVDQAEVDHLWDALVEGGGVEMTKIDVAKLREAYEGVPVEA